MLMGNQMFKKVKKICVKCKALVFAGVAVVGAAIVGVPGTSHAVNALTTAASTELADLQTDVVALVSIMIGVCVTLAIGTIIFKIVKSK